jgi:hypothetical protein
MVGAFEQNYAHALKALHDCCQTTAHITLKSSAALTPRKDKAQPEAIPRTLSQSLALC